MAPARRSVIGHPLSVVAVSVALTIGALEAVALVGLIDWRVAFRTGIPLGAQGRPWMSDHHRPDSELVWAHRPHVTERLQYDTRVWPDLGHEVQSLARVHYDNRGFRNEAELESADIALIGDSFLDWPLVADSDHVWHRLAQAMHVRVVNLGSPGYGPPQEEVVARRYVPPLHPRLVVWFFFEGNDLEDVGRYERYQHDYPPATRSDKGFLVRGFLPNARRRLLLMRKPALVPDADYVQRRSCALAVPGTSRRQHVFLHHTLPPLEGARLRQLAEAESSIVHAAALARQSGATFVLAFVPAKIRVYGARCAWPAGSDPGMADSAALPDSLSHWATAAGIPLIDLTPVLRKAFESGHPPYFTYDNHWNPAGHAAVSDTLSGFLAPYIRQ